MKKYISYFKRCLALAVVLSVLSALLTALAASSVIVRTGEGLCSYLKTAQNGSVFHIAQNTAMTVDAEVSADVSITGAERLDPNGHTIWLVSADAAVTADGELRIGTQLEGYKVLREAGTFRYTLAETGAPEIGEPVAGSKEEKTDTARYLFMDIDPAKGVTLSELREIFKFRGLADNTVTLLIDGNDGSGLVKTCDCLEASAYNEAGDCIARAVYTVIVMGDTNCNGRVNSSDAAILNSISSGGEYSREIRLAADVNFSGTAAEPKVNSSDAAYIMNKCFTWAAGKYVSNIK